MMRPLSHWASPRSPGFGQASIRLQLGDKELVRVPKGDSWALADDSVLTLCPRGKSFSRFDGQGNQLWTTGIYGGDDVRHPVVTRDTLYYYSHSSLHSVSLETGEGRSDSSCSIWRDVYPSRDGHLVSVEAGELIVLDEHLDEQVRVETPFRSNHVEHHPNACMITLSFDDKKLEHAVMNEQGEVLFESQKAVLFRGADLGDDLWQVLADNEQCEVLHLTRDGQATLHPLDEMALAVFGQPGGGFVALEIPRDEAAPLRLRDQDGQQWELGHAKITGLFANPDGSLLVAQEDGIRSFQDGRVEKVFEGSPCLPATLTDGSCLVVTPENTVHLARDGRQTVFPDAWAARQALGGEVTSLRVKTLGMGLDPGTPPGWHNFLKDAERLAGPPVGIPADGIRITGSRLDVVRSKSANSLARAGIRTATHTDGTGLISAAALAMRNRELDMLTALAEPQGSLRLFNTWCEVAADQTPAPPATLALDCQGAVSVDAAGNLLQIDIGYAPVTERPAAREVAGLALRVANAREGNLSALPAVCELISGWKELAPAANFVEKMARRFPARAQEAAQEAFKNFDAGEVSWLSKLYKSSRSTGFGLEYLRLAQSEDDLAAMALALMNRVPGSQNQTDILNMALTQARPPVHGSPLDQRVQHLHWLTRNWAESDLSKAAPVMLDLLFEKAGHDADRAVLRECASLLQKGDVATTTWWRNSVQKLDKLGEAREASLAIANGGARQVGLVEQDGMTLVGGSVLRSRKRV